ncbi:subclass B3 metallo-beta-lactamase [Acidobacteria bacterium AB60]|nr:subclass B3 metallo-beta-lactamase [Acidobacteria bacterium AB60]
MKRLAFLAVSLLVLAVPSLRAVPAEWTNPFPPFRIGGNLYYVGSQDLAAYLIVTPQGNILLNSNYVSSPAQIRQSIEKLGFKLRDTKILLVSHGHYDHAGGSAEIKRLTGARYEVMDGDVSVVETGGRTDFQFAHDKSMWFPPAHVDRELHDGDTVSLGGTTLTAHKTAGHTKGTTTWTMDVKQSGKTLHVLILGSPNVLDSYKLVDNPTYPHIADDFRAEFATLKALPCDIFLSSHGSAFDLQSFYDRLQKHDPNPYPSNRDYQAYVAERESAFEANFKRQQASRK